MGTESNSNQNSHVGGKKWVLAVAVTSLILNLATLLTLAFGGIKWVMETSALLNNTAQTLNQVSARVEGLESWRQEVNQRHHTENATGKVCKEEESVQRRGRTNGTR